MKTPTHACVRVLLFLLLLWWTSPLHVVFLFLQSIHHVCALGVLPRSALSPHLSTWSSDAAPHVPFLSSKIHICSWIGPPTRVQKTGLRRVQNRSFSFFRVFFCVCSPKVDFSSYAPPQDLSPRELDHVGSKLSPRDCREQQRQSQSSSSRSRQQYLTGPCRRTHTTKNTSNRDKQVTSHAAEGLHA